MNRRTVPAVLLAAALAASACASDDDSSGTNTTNTTDATNATASADETTSTPGTAGAPSTTGVIDAPEVLTLVAYDSFAVAPETFEPFTAETGIAVEVVLSGDAGLMLSKAALTAGNPEGDVMWGVDNTLLARALDADVFTPFESPELGALSPAGVELVPNHEATPVDEGDVCINYDVAWFEEHDLAVPASLDDLVEPAYKDLLVVEDPATSSPGLAFLLATVGRFGEDGWQQYWRDLRENGVEVVDGWETAYYESFSGSTGDGPRPLVVSYGTSPPVEVIYADPKPQQAPTGVIGATCFHQVEYAGILRGTDHPEAAGRLIDFLVSKGFQETLPLTLFVYPAREDATLPPEFVEYSVRPDEPLTVTPDAIEANAQDWIEQWTAIVVR